MSLTSGNRFGGRRSGRTAATVVAAAAACSGLTWTAVALTSSSTVAKPPVTCAYTPTKGGSRTVGVPSFEAAAAGRPLTFRLATGEGTVTVKALTEEAPCTTNSFSYLAGKKYFDGSKCHRLTTTGIFVLECGDPAGVGNSDPGYSYPDENLAGAVYPAGTVAVSKAQPGRNGGQFFISYGDPAFPLKPDWTPFGKVVEGLDVVKRIAAKGTANGAPDGAPKEPVVLTSVRVQSQ
ncbi:peptidylprolyl isomerase [Streptomyces sp. NPDC048603]|uniref:peptidylprolyl isomerase n=1 Tax=Streptomyces sp. NPDC048603 TaxID=3365577 RepID=UPI00371633A3